MPQFIVKLEDRYFDYSTIVDAPVTEPMTLEAYTEHYRTEFGERGMKELPARLERVEKHGTSSQQGETPEEMLMCNRAGPNESPCSIEAFRAWARGERECK